MSTAPSDLKEGDDVSCVPSLPPDSILSDPPAHPRVSYAFLERRWKWGASHPSGKVDEVVEGDASIETKKGNEVNRHGGQYESSGKRGRGGGEEMALQLIEGQQLADRLPLMVSVQTTTTRP